jgi:hypothetical protein
MLHTKEGNATVALGLQGPVVNVGRFGFNGFTVAKVML